MKDIKSKLLAALAAIQQASEDRKAGAVNSGEWGTADQALLVMFPSADSFTYEVTPDSDDGDVAITVTFLVSADSAHIVNLFASTHGLLPSALGYVRECILDRIEKLERSFFLLDSIRFDEYHQAAIICAWRMLLADCTMILNRELHSA